MSYISGNYQRQVAGYDQPIAPDTKKALTELAKIYDQLGGRDLNSVYIKSVGQTITFTNKNLLNSVLIWAKGLFTKNEEYNFENNIAKIANLFNQVPTKFTDKKFPKIGQLRNQLFKMIDQVATAKSQPTFWQSITHQNPTVNHDLYVKSAMDLFTLRTPTAKAQEKTTLGTSRLNEISKQAKTLRTSEEIPFSDKFVQFTKFRSEFLASETPGIKDKNRKLYFETAYELGKLAGELSAFEDAKYLFKLLIKNADKQHGHYQDALSSFCDICLGQRDYPSIKEVFVKRGLPEALRSRTPLANVQRHFESRIERMESFAAGPRTFPPGINVLKHEDGKTPIGFTKKEWEMIELLHNVEDAKGTEEPNVEDINKLRDFHLYISGNKRFNANIRELDQYDLSGESGILAKHEDLRLKLKAFEDEFPDLALYSFKADPEKAFSTKVRLEHIQLVNKRAEIESEIEKFTSDLDKQSKLLNSKGKIDKMQVAKPADIKKAITRIKSSLQTEQKKLEEIDKKIADFAETSRAELARPTHKAAQVKEPIIPKNPLRYTPYSFMQAESMARFISDGRFKRYKLDSNIVQSAMKANADSAEEKIIPWFNEQIAQNPGYESGDLSFTDLGKVEKLEKKKLETTDRIYKYFSAYGHMGTVNFETGEPYFSHQMLKFEHSAMKPTDFLVNDFYRVDFQKLVPKSSKEALTELMAHEFEEKGIPVSDDPIEREGQLYEWLSEDYAVVYEEEISQETPTQDIELKDLIGLKIPFTDDVEEFQKWLEQTNNSRPEGKQLSLSDILQICATGQLSIDWDEDEAGRDCFVIKTVGYGQLPSESARGRVERAVKSLRALSDELIEKTYTNLINTVEYRKKIFALSRLLGGPMGRIMKTISEKVDVSQYDYKKVTAICCSQFATMTTLKSLTALQKKLQEKYAEMKEEKGEEPKKLQFLDIPKINPSEFDTLTVDRAVDKLRNILTPVKLPKFYRWIFEKPEELLKLGEQSMQRYERPRSH